MLFTIALLVFGVSLVFFLFDAIDKTIVASIGALVLIFTGVLSFPEALHAIDFETLILLIGLMILVVIAEHSGIFSWLTTLLARKSGGSPILVLLLFTALVFFASTVLNNATVVLLVIPVAISLAKGLHMNAKLMVILLAIISNIGGTLTLIGDPPNTLIGVQVGLSFNAFVWNLAIPVFGMSFLILGYILFVYRKDFRSIRKNFVELFLSTLIIERIKYQYQGVKMDRYFVLVTSVIILLSILSFIFLQPLGVAVGALGMAAGILLAVLAHKKIDFVHSLKSIEWDSIVFFAALFVQVGALEKVGFLDMVTTFVASFSGNYLLLLMVILWGMGIASSVINNIPFVALMIPVIFGLQEQLAGTPHLDLLWWALALGACLGGNFTPIGSSSGIIALDIAKKQGIRISFWEFMKVGVPVTFISLIVSSAYLIVRYLYF